MDVFAIMGVYSLLESNPNCNPNCNPNPNFSNETYRFTSYPPRPFTTLILSFSKAHLTGD